MIIYNPSSRCMHVSDAGEKEFDPSELNCRFLVQLGAIEDEFSCGFIAQLYAIEKSSIIANYIIVLASCNAGG